MARSSLHREAARAFRGRRCGGPRTTRTKRITTTGEARKVGYILNAWEHLGHIPGEKTLQAVLRYIPVADKRALLSSLEDTTGKRAPDLQMHIDDFRQGEESLDDTIGALCRNDRVKILVHRSVATMLIGHLQRAEATGLNRRFDERLDAVASLFGLSESEVETLAFLFGIETDAVLDNLFDEVCDALDVRAYSKPLKAPRAVALLLGVRRHHLQRALGAESALMRCGLVASDKDLAEEIIDYLEGTTSKPMTGKYFGEYTGHAVAMGSHTVTPKHLAILEMLRGHCGRGQAIHVLLYGRPGTGKTEFARTLGRHWGLKTYEVRSLADEVKEERGMNLFRYRALTACQRVVDTAKSLIVVDEADTMLNAASSYFSVQPMAEKGLINKVLDQSRGFIVWITNRIDGIDPSTRRRFDYSIEFEPLTFEQRLAIWRSALRRYRLSRSFTEEQLHAFATDYESSAGGIDIALRHCARIRREQGKSVDLAPVVGGLMEAHLKILGQDRKSARASRPGAKGYSTEGLNVRGDLGRALRVLDRFNGHWARSAPDTDVRTMNLLLYGPPGTGKSELAKYVARMLKRRLLVKRASDLLSMWVGQTEKSIRDAFREAERDRAVLLIDEADSMLGSRAGAHASWEVSQVNELLCAMETFRGILICSTNFKTGLDPAAIRRFTLKLELDYLTPEGNGVFYRRFMEALVPTPPSAREREEIEALTHLTPGDFKVVYQSSCFMDKEELTHRVLIDALSHEVACKNEGVGKVMGFGKSAR